MDARPIYPPPAYGRPRSNAGWLWFGGSALFLAGLLTGLATGGCL